MPVEIEMTETAPGRWEVVKRLPGGTHAEEPEEPKPARARRRSPIHDIPVVGTPVDFFTIIGFLILISYLR